MAITSGPSPPLPKPPPLLGRRFRGSCLAALLLLLTGGAEGRPAAAEAQTDEASIGPPWEGPVRLRRPAAAEGLPRAVVYAAAQTPDGLLWFASEGGLARYDGYSFEIFAEQALDDRTVQALHLDDEGSLWLGTLTGGLVRYAPHSGAITAYRHRADDPTTLSDDEVRTLAAAGPGRLWVGTYGSGLNHLEIATGRIRRFRHQAATPGSLPGDRVTALAPLADGDLWVGTLDGGMARYDAAGDTFIPFRPSGDELPPALQVMALHLNQDGTLWVGTRTAGLLHLDPASGRFTPRDGLLGAGSGSIVAITEDRHGALWLGTRVGLKVFDPHSGRVRLFQHDPADPWSLGNNGVTSIFEDRAGLLWITTLSGGVSVYDRGQHSFAAVRASTQTVAGLSAPTVRAIFQDRDGVLWVGTDEGGLDRYDPRSRQWQRFRHRPEDPTSLGDDYVGAILRDRQGTLWVGTARGGLNRLDEASGAFTRLPMGAELPGALPPEGVVELYEDRAGTLWVGLWGGGFYRLDRTAQHFEALPLLAAAEDGPNRRLISAVAEDEAGTLWVAILGHGVVALSADRQTQHLYRHDPAVAGSLPDNQINDLHLDPGGDLWVITGHGALARRPAGSDHFETHRLASDVPDSLYQLLVDPASDELWISSNRGLWRYDPTSGQTCRYGVADGLQDEEFNLYASYRNPRSGEMFFGGIAGFNRFFPNRVGKTAISPPVVLTSVDVLGTPSGPPGAAVAPTTLTLSHRQRLVSFEFAVLDYRTPEENRYAYRLVGQDAGWNEAGHRRYASYTNLPPGRYRFEVRGASSGGMWSQQPTTLSLRVVPPLWGTWWFRILTGGMLVALVAGTPLVWSRRRLRRAAREQAEAEEIRHRLLTARERERSHLARELHDGPLQDLHALTLSLRRSPDGAQERLGTITRTLRTLCGELRPPALHVDGLDGAVRDHIARLRQRLPDLHVELALMRDGATLPAAVRTHLFRIFQEAVANTVAHAEAQRLWVGFDLDAEGCVLTVRDDGRGFQPPDRWVELARREKFGLLGMAERAAAAGGRLAIASHPGGGTELRVEVPASRLEVPASRLEVRPV